MDLSEDGAGANRETGSLSESFLQGGGEMGALIRAHDWSKTTLGEPGHWPQPLRTTLRLLLNTGHPMYIWWGPELLCFYNDAYRPSIGPERHPSSVGLPARVVWEEIWDIIGPQIGQVMSGGGPTWSENALIPITRNGQREDVYWTYSYGPIDDPDAANGVGGVLVVCAETTSQVFAARQASEERARLAELFEQAPGFMCTLRGPDHVFDLVNPAYLQLLGHRNLIGRTVREAVPEVEGQGFFELLDQVYRSGEAFSTFGAEISLQPKPGAPLERRFIDYVYQPIRNAAGEVTGIFVEGVDVTNRALAEAARDATEIELRALNTELERRVEEKSAERDRLWRTSQDLLSVVGPDGVFQAANPAWMTILGWREDEVVGRHHLFFNHLDDHPGSIAALELATRDRLPAYENWTLHKDGTYRRISWIAAAEGGLVYASGRHITAEYEARQELADAHEALRQSQKMEAVGQLTGGIAHDFNNLLAGISGSLELLEVRLSQGRLADLNRYITTANESARRAAALTQRLLAFARRQTLDPKAIDANHMVAGMVDLVQRSVGPTVRVEVTAAEGLWAIKVDQSQLENAVLNLCINARDAMAPDGGTIAIKTANDSFDERAARERELPPGDYISVCVTDTGTGMAADVIDKAFDPFFTTKPLGQGTGLGLSMIYGFVRQSGGQIRIHSVVGKGTTMCLYLPRYAGEADETRETPDAMVDQGGGETVLIIDDEPAIRMLTSEVLEENGYQVLQAEDGAAGLKLLQSDLKIDILITDVGLPGGLNGRQVADAARVQRPKLKVLFITGYAENAAVGNGLLDAGMSVITKPFVMTALANKVREIIDT